MTLWMPSPALAVRILIIQDIQNVSVMHPFLVPRSPLVCCRTLIGLHASCILSSPALPSHGSRSLSLPSPLYVPPVGLLAKYQSALHPPPAAFVIYHGHSYDNETGLGHLYGYGDGVNEARSASMKRDVRI